MHVDAAQLGKWEVFEALPGANVVKAFLCVVMLPVQSAPGVCGFETRLPYCMAALFDSLSSSDADTGAQTRPSSSLIL